jgi:hypothetical protein
MGWQPARRLGTAVAWWKHHRADLQSDLQSTAALSSRTTAGSLMLYGMVLLSTGIGWVSVDPLQQKNPRGVG